METVANRVVEYGVGEMHAYLMSNWQLGEIIYTQVWDIGGVCGTRR